MVLVVARKDLGYSLQRIAETMLLILTSEAQGRELGYSDLMDLLKTDFKTVQRYIGALEDVGWVEVVPTERKNVVKLTEKGRCIAKCLVS